ncbi:unnamed protein product, partial [Phaeothamnion confervicola]
MAIQVQNTSHEERQLMPSWTGKGKGRLRNIAPSPPHENSLFKAAPPALPHVDQCQLRPELSFGAIARRRAVVPLPISEPGRSRGHASVRASGSHAAVPTRPLPQIVAVADEHGGEAANSLFSEEEMDKVMSFMDSRGDNNQTISFSELCGAFRLMRRARANARHEAAGRAAVGKLVRLIERCGMGLNEWFSFMDVSSGGGGDGRLTVVELREGIRRMAAVIAKRERCCQQPRCRRTPNYGVEGGMPTHCSDHFSRGHCYIGSRRYLEVVEDPFPDLTCLLQYIDADADFLLDLGEVKQAVELLRADTVAARLAAEAGAVIVRLEEHMRATGLRLLDLFHAVDADRDTEISRDELRAALQRIARSPSGGCGGNGGSRGLGGGFGFGSGGFGSGGGIRGRPRTGRNVDDATAAARRAALPPGTPEGRRRADAGAEAAAAARITAAKAAGAYAALHRLSALQRRTDLPLRESLSRSGFGAGRGSMASSLEMTDLTAFAQSADVALSVRESRALFQFLDRGGSGRVAAPDLDDAVRQFRRDKETLRKISGDATATSRGAGHNYARDGAINGAAARPGR